MFFIEKCLQDDYFKLQFHSKRSHLLSVFTSTVSTFLHPLICCAVCTQGTIDEIYVKIDFLSWKLSNIEIFQIKFIFPASTFMEKKTFFFCKTVDFDISLNHSSLCMLWSLKKLASDTTAIIFHRNSNILTVFFCILNKKIAHCATKSFDCLHAKVT